MNEVPLKALDAIQYLVDRGYRATEWMEAGMWNAVEAVMADTTKTWLTAELDKMIMASAHN